MKRIGKRFSALILAGFMGISNVLTGIQAQETEPQTPAAQEEMVLDETDPVDSDSYDAAMDGSEVQGTAGEVTPQEQLITNEPETRQLVNLDQIFLVDQITRAQWLHNLVEAFGLELKEEEIPDAYYPDVLKDHDLYSDIVTAVYFGLVDQEPGSLLQPDQPADRDFAAYSLNQMVSILPVENTDHPADLEECAHQDTALIAVAEGWFETVNGGFLPDQPLTRMETENLMNCINGYLNLDEIPDEPADEYVFADFVNVLPKSLAVAETEDHVVQMEDQGQNIQQGQTFVYWNDGFPVFCTAQTISKQGSRLTVVWTEADVDQALVSVNTHGSRDVSLETFEPENGFQSVYAANEAEAASLSEQYGISVKKDSVVVTQDFKLSNGIKVSFTCNLSDLKFEHQITNKQNCSVYVRGNYTITTSTSLDLIQAALAEKSMTLGTVSVGGVGKVTLTLELALGGHADLTYKGTFKTGVKLYNGRPGLENNFYQTNFSSYIEAEANLGLRATFAIDLFIAKGQVYAETGLRGEYKSNTYNDGVIPNKCDNLLGWLYARTGASASIGIDRFSKSFSDSWEHLNWKNSPVKLSYHWEDGVRVGQCARNNKYYISGNSKYGSTYGNGFGGNGSGVEPVIIYTYSLNEENEATITGYQGNSSVARIPSEIDGYPVKAIGKNAFAKNTNLRIAVIPDSVISIGEYAFSECTNLSSVTLPSQVVSIGGRAFAYCHSLTSITIPKTLKETTKPYENHGGWGWRYGIFYECKNLRTAVFEEGTTEMCPGIFAYCTGLSDVTIPSTVTKIGDSEFAYCPNLKEIRLPEKLIEIDNSAFSHAAALQSVVIPSTVTKIGDYSFQHCDSLQSVDLGKVSTVGGRAFGWCNALTSVRIPKTLRETTKPYENHNGWDWRYGIFYECENLSYAEFEEGTVTTCPGVFGWCTGLQKVTIPKTVIVLSESLFRQCPNLTDVQIPQSVTTIENHAFSECTSLKKMHIPNSVTEVGEYAFKNCSSLSDVVLSKNLLTLGGRAFENCHSIETIEIPKKLKETTRPYENRDGWDWYPGVFYDAQGLKNIRFEEGTTIVVDGLFASCPGLESVVLPDSIKEIQNEAFSKCKNLKTITFGKNVSSIKGGAFSKSGLETIELPETLTSLGDGVFTNCQQLKTCKWNKVIKSIPERTFLGCTALESFDVPDQVTIIKSSAFEKCTALQNIKFGNNLEEIYSNAFYECSALSELSSPILVKRIWGSAFNKSGLKKVNIHIKQLEDAVFKNCKELEEVSLGNEVKALGKEVFSSCSKLKSVKLDGIITVIPKSTFSNCTELREFTVPRFVESINESAFLNDLNLKKIMIPQSVTKIHDTALSYPDITVIYGIPGSYAQTFANEKGFEFVSAKKAAEAITFGDKTAIIYTSYVGEYPILDYSIEPADLTDPISFRSSDEKIATIDQYGIIRGQKTGKCTIKVTAGNVTSSTVVEIRSSVWNLYIPSSLSLRGDGQKQLEAEFSPEDTFNQEVIWTSSNPEIASVSDDGLVTAHKKGQATITATSAEKSSIKSNCKVTVTNTVKNISSLDQFESSHPYENNSEDEWIYECGDVPSTIITFDERTCFEDGFDYLEIIQKDKNGKTISSEKYTGTQLSGQSLILQGSTVIFKLQSDGGGNEWGFKVTSIETGKTQLQDSMIKVASENWIYTGKAICPAVTVQSGSALLKENKDYTLSYSNNIKPGKGKVTVEGIGDYSGRIEKQFTIQKAKPEVSDLPQEITLTEGHSREMMAESPFGSLTYISTDSSVVSVQNGSTLKALKPGTAVITVTIAESECYEAFTAQIRVTVEASKPQTKTITQEMVSMSSGPFIYRNAYILPNIIVKDGNTVLRNNEDYFVSYSNNFKPGTATAAVTGINAYSGTVTLSFTIEKANPIVNDLPSSLVLNEGESIKLITETSYGQLSYESSNSAIARVENNSVIKAVKAGNAQITASIAETECFVAYSKRIPITVQTVSIPTKPILEHMVSIGSGPFVYNGSAHRPAVTIMDQNKKLSEGTDYLVRYENNVSAGMASIYIDGIGVYSGSLTLWFRIEKAGISLPNLPEDLVLEQGTSRELLSKWNGKDILYSSDNAAVIQISQNTISALQPGQAVITAKIQETENYTGAQMKIQVTVTAKEIQSITMHRMYNPNSGEHFYTARESERDDLIKAGWRYEGEAWQAPKTSSIPVYRLYNPNAGDHHYTSDVSEKDFLCSVGWRYEGIGWYSDEKQGTALYRLYNPNAKKAGAHHYTASLSESQFLESVGWRSEGIGWFGLK